MEKEISSGAMLGIVLIALAAIIGIGFGVFAIAKGTANTGVTNVQEKLESVSQSDYTDYDQTIVTGTQVKSAYDNFAGKSACVLIATQATKDNSNGTNAAAGKPVIKAGAAGVAKAYEAESKVPLVCVYTQKTTTSGNTTTTSRTEDIGWKTSKNEDLKQEFMINYNALLASSEGGSSVEPLAASDAVAPAIYFDTNCFRTDYGYYAKEGKVQFNFVSGNLSKSGMMEFLPTSARFQSYLVKDASGTIMGVAFEQISSK